MPLWRGYKQYVYHVCSVCGFRQPLSKMIWQNGILRCSVTDCIDKRIIGSRDIDVARTVAVNRHELEPDPKLTQPVDRKDDQNEVLY
jgi:hypothetical protein